MPSTFRRGAAIGNIGGEVLTCFNAVNGGKGTCHCERVGSLLGRVMLIVDKSGSETNKCGGHIP